MSFYNKRDEWVVGERLLGFDGSRTEFTLQRTPVPGSVAIVVGGLRQIEGPSRGVGDYTISGKTITFFDAHPKNTVAQADYAVLSR